MNNAIRDCIEDGIISSTSCMAASKGGEFMFITDLYRKYSDKISFGAHLNLTSGEPLTINNISLFLNTGFCKMNEGKVVFNGMTYRWKYIPKNLRIAIYDELDAQIKRIENEGVKISHIDSHQYIHFSPWLMPIFCNLAEEHGIHKMRRPKSLKGHSLINSVMSVYDGYLLYNMRHLRFTYYFYSAEDFIKLKNKKDGVYELMCHPGHDKRKYQEEMVQLKEYLHNHPEYKIITYNNL